MACSINRVTLLGKLVGEVHLHTTQAGQTITTLTMRTRKTWVNRMGHRKTRDDEHKIVVSGEMAKLCAKHLRHNSSFCVEGELSPRYHICAEGKGKDIVEVAAHNIVFCGPRMDHIHQEITGHFAPEANG